MIDRLRSQRRSPLGLVLVTAAASLLATASSCEEDEASRPPPDERRGQATFLPLCGSPNDIVMVRELVSVLGGPERCSASNMTVFFEGGEAPAQSVRLDDAGGCVVEAVVPASARTGNLVLRWKDPPVGSGVEGKEVESRSNIAFEVPCPGDAGTGTTPDPVADAGDAGPDASAPGIVHGYFEVTTTFVPNIAPTTTLAGEFYPPDVTKTPRGARDRLLHAGVAGSTTEPWTAIGQCGPLSRPPPENTTSVNVGNIELRAGDALRGTAKPASTNLYLGNFTPVAGESLSVAFVGTAGFPAATIPDATITFGEIVVTQPNISTGAPFVLESNFTTKYDAPAGVDRLYVQFTPKGPGASWRCRLDPAATTFTTSTANAPFEGTLQFFAVKSSIATVNGRAILLSSIGTRNAVSYSKL